MGTNIDLISNKKDQELPVKKLDCKSIKINTSKEVYDANYKASKIQTFISKYKDRQLAKLYQKLKELEEKIKKLTNQMTQ